MHAHTENLQPNLQMVCVVAMAENRVIGDGTGLVWHVPGDLKRVKSLTMGCPLLMGRKTYQSIGRPLAGRANIVITRHTSFQERGIIVVANLEEAIKAGRIWLNAQNIHENTCENTGENRLILFGGGQIYAAGLKYCSLIEATLLEGEAIGKVYFPALDEDEWHDTCLARFHATSDHPAFSYHRFTRKTAPAPLP